MSECEPKLVHGARVLDVGSGSGYLCAAFYEMVKDPVTKKAHIVGIEHIEGLTQWSIENLTKSYKAQLDDGSNKVICGDGRQGYEPGGPYDVIHVGAMGSEVPKPLLE